MEPNPTEEAALIKKEKLLHIRKFRRDRVESYRLPGILYKELKNCANMKSYMGMGKPIVIYDFALDPFQIAQLF